MQDRSNEIIINVNEDTEYEEIPLNDEPFMKEFVDRINKIKNDMALIRENMRKIRELAFNIFENKNEELDELVTSTNVIVERISSELKKMDNETKNEPIQAYQTIRKNMHGLIVHKFIDLMKEYQQVQTSFQEKYKEKITRQYKIIKPDVTDEEINKVLENGEGNNLMQKYILDMEHKEDAMNALTYIEFRHQGILKLEKSIQELNQLFQDMSILIDTQQEIIDNIETNVNTSVSYTKTAVKELHTANTYQKKSRKKMCCLIICGIIVFVITGVVLGVIFIPHPK